MHDQGLTFELFIGKDSFAWLVLELLHLDRRCLRLIHWSRIHHRLIPLLKRFRAVELQLQQTAANLGLH